MAEKAVKMTLQELGIGDDEPPASLNWADQANVVGAVKNQGQCGSGWAFATVGLLEGQERLNSTGSIVQLSAQQLIDCDRSQMMDRGCNGGIMEEALDYIMAVGGLETNQDYPYKSSDGQDTFECQFDKTKAFVTTRRIKKRVVLGLQSEDELKMVLAKYGPIAIGIDARLDTFKSYKSGVFFDERCSSYDLSHAVLLVGYGTSDKGQQYWIIKNSWSVQWGQEGYVWLARNKRNQCGVMTRPTISIADKD